MIPAGAESAPAAGSRAGRYDAGARRAAQRTGRQKGCRVYIAAEELAKTGYGDEEGTIYYRVWGAARGRITIQLYRRG